MKNKTAFIAVILLGLLSACNNPIIIPAEIAITLPPNQGFILRATLPVTSDLVGETPTSGITSSPTPKLTLTPVFTPTRANRKSPYPAAQGTPVIDMGFQPITVDNIARLTPVFNALFASPRHSVLSGDGQKLFLSTSDGTFLFNRRGEILGHWQNIFTSEIPCESCISTNRDGSRLAVISRNAGTWEAQVFDVKGDQVDQVLALPSGTEFLGQKNEAGIALSPDGETLAFKSGASTLRVLDLQTKLQVFSDDRQLAGMSFTPDGGYFVAHSGQELLFYKVDSWGFPTRLRMPRDDTAYAFSPDGSMVALALPATLRIYSIESLKMLPEINVPPISAVTRQWRIDFIDNTTLAGYAYRWDSYKKETALIETGQWDVQTGKTLRFDQSTSNSPDALLSLWGSPLTLPAARGELETGASEYYAFRFTSEGVLLVNSPHSACWLKLPTGEATCFKDPDHYLFASDANVFREWRDNENTNLTEFRTGAFSIGMGPYPVVRINHNGEWSLVDNGTGTDLYTKGKPLPQESVKGSLQGFAENAKQIVFTTLQNENTYNITVVNKATGDAKYQKKDNFLFKPVVMTADGTIYYTQKELGLNQTVFNIIDPKTEKISELTRMSLPAEIRTLILSSTGLFAAGQKDGAVMIMTQDGSQSASFQAATSSVEGLSFSPDGRFLAVVSGEGVRVYAVLFSTK